MNERKKQVIEKAHQLLIDKGYQATSIQDILDYSGISKGTFYNYFSSKGDLLKAVFNSLQESYEIGRNELLMGENFGDIEIFIKQLELTLKYNRKNKLFFLIEEIYVSNDPDLKDFIKKFHLKNINWMFNRFTDIFGEEKRPFLLDCTILFSGMLQQSFQYNVMARSNNFKAIDIIRYCVERIKAVVEDVSNTRVQLLNPDILINWLPDSIKEEEDIHQQLVNALSELKSFIKENIIPEQERMKYLQTADFIQEEILHNKMPRSFLIESTILMFKNSSILLNSSEFIKVEKLVASIVFQAENQDEMIR